MTTDPTLQADVQKQVGAGFSLQEIEQNLRSNGYTQEQIDEALSETNIQKAVAENSREPVSYRSVYLIMKAGAGCLFALYAFAQSGGFNSNNSAILGVLALVAAALTYYQIKRA